MINPVLLESIAKVLAIDPYVIRNFNEERAIQIITSSLNKNITEEPDEESLGFGQFANTVSRYHGHHTQFSPYEKLIELYEKLLNEKDEKIKNLIRIAEPENIQ